MTNNHRQESGVITPSVSSWPSPSDEGRGDVPHADSAAADPMRRRGNDPAPLPHERHAYGKLAAHTKPGDEPVQRKIPERLRQPRSPRAYRVHQDCDDHRLRAAKPIANDAKDQAASRPTIRKSR